MRNAKSDREGRLGREHKTSQAAEDLFLLPACRHPALVPPCPQDVVLGSEWPFPIPRDVSLVCRDDVQLVECIGRGSYGTVFTAWLAGVGVADETWAIKVGGVYEDPWEGVRAGVRFSQEAFCLWRAGVAARTGSRGRCNVVGIRGCVMAPPRQCLGIPVGLVLEHCIGGDLFDVLSMSPTLADPAHFGPSGRVDARARVAEQVCNAVAAFAAAGLVHNDIKPENLFLRRRGITSVDGVLRPDDVALGDAGAARAVAQPLCGGRGLIVGTLPYTAPEIAAAAASAAHGCVAAAPAADVYSAGVTLLLLIVKKFPWQLPDSEVSRWAVAGRVVDHLARHAVPSDPTFVNVLLWMTDVDPGARPSATTAREIFAWLQEDLWTHGSLCLHRLRARWDMPQHPKLGLFPAKIEPAVGPQHSKAPLDAHVLRDAACSTYDVPVLASPPSALLRSLSWEWPEVLSSTAVCCTGADAETSAARASVCDTPGCGRSRTRSHTLACIDSRRSQPQHSTPFMDAPPRSVCRMTPCRDDSLSVVPVFDSMPRHSADPPGMPRGNYGASLSPGMRSKHCEATPSLSGRPPMLASASVSSGPLTSLHQAFPSCCGPPSVQASVMSRTADALPEVEEPLLYEPCAIGSDCHSAWVSADTHDASCGPWEDHPASGVRSPGSCCHNRPARPPQAPLAQRVWPFDPSDDLTRAVHCDLLGCCDAPVLGGLLGTLRGGERTARTQAASQRSTPRLVALGD